MCAHTHLKASVELLQSARDGEGLHLLAGQGQRDAHLRFAASDQMGRALLQRQRRPRDTRRDGWPLRQRLVHQLESILH